jgi:hypothetical protein
MQSARKIKGEQQKNAGLIDMREVKRSNELIEELV